MDMRHFKVPCSIDMFRPTGIKDTANANISCITYKGTMFNIHDPNNKESYFLQFKTYKDIIKDHCIRHVIWGVFNVKHPQYHTKKVDIFVQIGVFKL